MLTTLEAYSSWQSAPILPLSDFGPQTDLLQVRDISGLGPAKANVNTVPFGSVDGSSYTGGMVETRNILITVGLNPDWADWSMEALRRLLYAYFMPKHPVRLVFHSNDEMPTVEITGITETVEPSLFSKDGEFVVSVLCPDPYFTTVEPIIVAGSTTYTSGPVEIEYKGTEETGFNFKLVEAAPPAPWWGNFKMKNLVDEHFVVPIIVNASSYFVLNTVASQKYVQTVERGSGIITNLLSIVQPGSKWLKLQPGPNTFEAITDVGGTQDWELTYYEKYGGL